MARFIKKQKKEIGMSPDQLLFRGEPKAANVLLRVTDYNGTDLEETKVDNVNDVLKYVDKESVTWFNIDGLHDTSIMEEISKGFHLDILLLADVMTTSSRPKVIEYDNGLFISVKMLSQDQKSNLIVSENISLIVTRSVLLTFQEMKGDVFDPIRDRIRKKKRRIRSSGTDYLAFTILDVIIDNYIYLISLLGEKIETLDEELISNPKPSILEEINSYKKELNYLRKNVNTAKEMITTLAKMDTDFINEANEVHFLELQNNISQASESSESYRDILSDQLNIYHTTISTRLNDIMKFLTVFSVVFIPLTFIAGIYGTNFDFLPELHYKYSYFIMLGVMLAIAGVMLVYFKRRNWF